MSAGRDEHGGLHSEEEEEEEQQSSPSTKMKGLPPTFVFVGRGWSLV